MQNTIIGIYDDYSQAQSALNALVKGGFDRGAVRVSPEQESSEARRASLAGSDADEGWSLGKFFKSLFGTDEEATAQSGVYHEAVRRGSYMVTVDADNEAQHDKACEILNRFSPVDIDDRSTQWRSKGWSGYDRTAAPYTDEEVKRERALYGAGSSTGKTTTASAGEARLPVIEEELRVGKRSVQRGGVRIYQHVSERPVQETVHLRDEKVKVKRQPVNKPATQADLAAFKEGSIELRETAEEPVVSKDARVVEEVLVNKDVRERDETVKGTVRRTDVDVEQLGGARADAASFDDTYYRQHWQSSFANQGGRYEDYEPAYRFGNSLQGNSVYRSRTWNDIEPEVRRDWESKNASSPWERSKDAVRHAWERGTR